MEYLGTSYNGSVKDGRFAGKGTYSFQTGTKYVGELKDGMFHGKGRKSLNAPDACLFFKDVFFKRCTSLR